MDRHSGERWEQIDQVCPNFVYLFSASFRKVLLDSELPITDPRTGAPCVISTCVCQHSWRLALASWPYYQLTLWGIDKISVLGSKLIELVERFPNIFQLNLPTTLLSSAYHFCVKESLWSLVIGGRIAIPYIAIARGSPCVVTSWGRMVDLPM